MIITRMHIVCNKIILNSVPQCQISNQVMQFAVNNVIGAITKPAHPFLIEKKPMTALLSIKNSSESY